MLARHAVRLRERLFAQCPQPVTETQWQRQDNSQLDNEFEIYVARQSMLTKPESTFPQGNRERTM